MIILKLINYDKKSFTNQYIHEQMIGYRLYFMYKTNKCLKDALEQDKFGIFLGLSRVLLNAPINAGGLETEIIFNNYLMTPQTLAKVKNELKSFYLLFNEYVKYAAKNNTFPVYNVLNILLQNMQFYSPESQGYNHNDEEKDLYEIEAIFNKFKTYYPNHDTIIWLCDEVSTILRYADMFEEPDGMICEESQKSI